MIKKLFSSIAIAACFTSAISMHAQSSATLSNNMVGNANKPVNVTKLSDRFSEYIYETPNGKIKKIVDTKRTYMVVNPQFATQFNRVVRVPHQLP